MAGSFKRGGWLWLPAGIVVGVLVSFQLFLAKTVANGRPSVWFAARSHYSSQIVGTALAILRAGPGDQGGLGRAFVPDGGLSPDAAVSAGRVHVAYGLKGHVYYASSTDDGKTFSKPIRISTPASSGVIGHERGPKVALGRDGAIHVAWQGSDSHTVLYARSTEGGKQFSEPRNLAPPNRGLDGASIAADDTGQVYVVWHMDEAGPESPGSTFLQLAYSNDNGNTFAPVRKLTSSYPGGACGCCMLKAAIGPDRELLVGFRGGYHNIRDIYLLRGRVPSARLEAALVSNDRWELEGCPMQGPSLQATPGSREILVSWMSRGQVYRAVSKDGGRTFSPRTAPAGPKTGVRRDPLLLANQRGEILFAWVEDGKIRWERISPDGRVPESGENRRMLEDSKPAAFAGRDGSFVLLY